MKVLYACQKTGNGHIARAQELVPIIAKYANVEVLVSGSNAQISLNHKIDYSFKGISLFYKEGKVSYLKTFFKNNFFTFLYNVLLFPCNDYDLIINDFEPITAWACKLKGGKIIALSHQASMLFNETPKPNIKSSLGMNVLKYYAPVNIKYGFHFKSYHPNIFLPVIRQKIKSLLPVNQKHYVVYLPAYRPEELIPFLSKINVEWHIFSKQTITSYSTGNCHFNPINEDDFLSKIASCEGVLCNAGFELPTEALFLKKKLFVIPIQLQLEQAYNAISAAELGVNTSNELDFELINNWVNSSQKINFTACTQIEEILEELIQKHAKKIAN